mgnify:CR=1 FL=1
MAKGAMAKGAMARRGLSANAKGACVLAALLLVGCALFGARTKEGITGTSLDDVQSRIQKARQGCTEGYTLTVEDDMAFDKAFDTYKQFKGENEEAVRARDECKKQIESDPASMVLICGAGHDNKMIEIMKRINNVCSLCE